MFKKISCTVCSLPLEQSKAVYTSDNGHHPAVCGACLKFFKRHKDKPLDTFSCMSETFSCLNDGSKTVRIGNGNMWRMSCKRCRLIKCFKVGLDSATPTASVAAAVMPLESPTSSEESIPNRHKIFEAANLARKLFGNNSFLFDKTSKVEVANMISALIVNFAKSFKSFNLLTDSEQLSFTQQMASTFVLTLLMTTQVGDVLQQNNQNKLPIVEIFPMFGNRNNNKLAQLREQFHHWQPSSEEVACMFAMLLGKSALSQQPESALVSEIASVIANNIDGNRMKIFSDITDLVLIFNS